MNKKGFTLVELLAVVVIIGILSGTAIAGVSRHLEKAEMDSFNTMRLSACDAIKNKIMQERITCIPPTGTKAEVAAYKTCDADNKNKCCFELADLVAQHYLEPLKDPSADDAECKGKVYIESINSSNSANSYDQYDIRVILDCKEYETRYTDTPEHNSQMCSNLTTNNFKKN